MKALGKLKKEKGLWLYEAPMPSPGPHDLLIRVQQTGICGTDIHIYEWDAWAQKTIPVPMTVGHEFVGIVEKVGTEVKNFQPGDRVSGEGHLVCGACRNCRAGRRHLCSRTLAVVITELNPYRLALAAKMHPTRAVDLTKEDLPSVMKELGIAEGFGVGLEMSGHPAGLQQMIDAMRPGGKIALLGILPDGAGIDWTKVIFKGLVMKGIYGREMYETWYKMLSMLQSGLDISAVATHHFPAGEFQQGFDLVRQGKSGKVILDWR